MLVARKLKKAGIITAILLSSEAVLAEEAINIKINSSAERCLKPRYESTPDQTFFSAGKKLIIELDDESDFLSGNAISEYCRKNYTLGVNFTPAHAIIQVRINSEILRLGDETAPLIGAIANIESIYGSVTSEASKGTLGKNGVILFAYASGLAVEQFNTLSARSDEGNMIEYGRSSEEKLSRFWMEIAQ